MTDREYVTYQKGEICYGCGNLKRDKDKPPKCVGGRRHWWNTEPLRIKVQKVPCD